MRGRADIAQCHQAVQRVEKAHALHDDLFNLITIIQHFVAKIDAKQRGTASASSSATSVASQGKNSTTSTDNGNNSARLKQCKRINEAF